MGMFYNGAKCDIYIGKGAGKKLLNDIRNAKESIKIVSPYLSPFLISELIELRRRNLEVQLITTDNLEDYYREDEKNIRQLIIQNRETDDEAVIQREKWRKIYKITTYSNIILIAVYIGLIYLIKEPKIAYGLIPIIVLALIAEIYSQKVKKKRIYSYWYSQLFPFKVYMSPQKDNDSDTFIHSKIYLIDDKIAYLGSLNFTYSGTKKNYETRIRTEDFRAIQEIKDEINQLLNHSYLPERDIQFWGKGLYDEPIN